jgi:hypothetical protein
LFASQQILQGRAQTSRVKCQLLADGERGSVMVDPEGEKLHSVNSCEFKQL